MLECPDVHDNHVRVRFIGRRDLLPESLREAMGRLERGTAGYERFALNIALAYGGREEVSDAFREYLAHEIRTGKTIEMMKSPDVHENHVRIRFIGRRDLLPESLRDAMGQLEQATAGYERFALNIALAYGGREEVSDAFREYLAHEIRTGKTIEHALEAFSPKALERYLYTSGLPEPDLLIRTSGEVRMSGFLMWQSAYSEYYFCDTNWPAFRKIDFLRALRSYDERQRRFGR